MKYNLFLKISKQVLCAGFLLLTFGIICSKSWSQANLKIGTVDVRKVYENWSDKIAADAIFDPDRKKLEAAQDAITTARANLEKKRNVLTPEKIKAEEQKVNDMIKEFDKNFQEVGRKIDQKAAELSKKLDDLLQKAYKDVAEKDGYTIILDSRSVRYSSQQIDLTDKITTLVNNASKSKEK